MKKKFRLFILFHLHLTISVSALYKSHEGLINVLAAMGTVVIISSSRFPIAGGSNKRKAKAASFSFNPERTLQLQNYRVVPRFIPSVSLKVRV